MARLTLVGDLMLDRLVNDVIAAEPPEALWGNTLPLLRRADLLIGNLECTISDRGAPFQPPRVFSFRAVPEAVEVLEAAGFDLVSQANNHALDYGEEALLDCLGRLRAAGIGVVGAGADLEAAWAPAVLEANGLVVGVLAAADHYPEYGAGADRPGIAYAPIGPQTLEGIGAGVARLRAEGARLVVASVHWGPNMRRTPMPGFPEVARRALELGVDVWHGHSAHLFQGIEFHGGGVILYDTGDFLDDYAVDPVERNDRSLLFEMTVEDGRISEVVGHPVELTVGRVGLAERDAFAFVERRLGELCDPFDTRVEREGESLRIMSR